ncbi:uncharacterized protein A4U43_C04F19690 [Asparagus officinalis]|uniref:Uncharacterized protein n=1 Tax=Asparagus officinalis TaxID=4686 RepID=A0A5P1F2R7_ASPOF|nr:uncharacterized protein A4U43_C04F19690 [Asparagus officinalis]
MALNPLAEGRDSDGDSEDEEEDGGGGEMVKDAAPERWDVLGSGQVMYTIEKKVIERAYKKLFSICLVVGNVMEGDN